MVFFRAVEEHAGRSYPPCYTVASRLRIPISSRRRCGAGTKVRARGLGKQGWRGGAGHSYPVPTSGRSAKVQSR